MPKKPLIIMVAIAVAGLGVAAVSLKSPAPLAQEINQAGPPPQHDELALEKMGIKTVKGKRHEFEIEVARTPAEQAYGLMYRKEMDPDHGMLFLFPSEDERSFWMKNTLIPLDMIFIKADGTIHAIHESAVPNDLTPILSNGPVIAVLELNGGRAADLGIKAGDRVFYKAFQPLP